MHTGMHKFGYNTEYYKSTIVHVYVTTVPICTVIQKFLLLKTFVVVKDYEN